MLVVDVGRVVAVAVVGGVVVVVVVDETAGFQMLNTQKVGSEFGSDSGPGRIALRLDGRAPCCFTYHKTRYHSPHLTSKKIIKTLSFDA